MLSNIIIHLLKYKPSAVGCYFPLEKKREHYLYQQYSGHRSSTTTPFLLRKKVALIWKPLIQLFILKCIITPQPSQQSILKKKEEKKREIFFLTPELCIYILTLKMSFLLSFSLQNSSHLHQSCQQQPCPHLPTGVKHQVTYPHLLKNIQQHSAFPLVFSSLGELSACCTISVILNHRQAAFQTHYI